MSCQPSSSSHCPAPGVAGGLTSKGWERTGARRRTWLGTSGWARGASFPSGVEPAQTPPRRRPLAFCFWGPSWGTTTCVKPPESQPRRPRPPTPGGTPTMAAQRGPVQSHRPAARRRFTRLVRLARLRSARSAAQRLGSTRALQRTASPPCVRASRKFESASRAPPPLPRPSLSLVVARFASMSRIRYRKGLRVDASQWEVVRDRYSLLGPAHEIPRLHGLLSAPSHS
jgi:hypothetical protein